jgi:hypothetical protein
MASCASVKPLTRRAAHRSRVICTGQRHIRNPFVHGLASSSRAKRVKRPLGVPTRYYPCGHCTYTLAEGKAVAADKIA